MARDDHNLDRLVRVPASEAIGGEATHFTPWLATHIDLLSDRIGLQLNFGEGANGATILRDHTEVPVGGFFLDVMAYTDDGRVVAIENQYGKADHDHLGKIITYASGVGADVIIWISEYFSDAHLTAIQWLNERTDEECGVYAVELAFYRIGDSHPAPLFTPLVQPSPSQRQARKNFVESQRWTTEEFLDALASDEDRAKVSEILRHNHEVGGGLWFGKRGGGSLLLDPEIGKHSTIGLSVSPSGLAMVSGLWTQFTDTFRHHAYQPMADLLGLPISGPASAVPLSTVSVHDLWSCACQVASALPLSNE